VEHGKEAVQDVEWVDQQHRELDWAQWMSVEGSEKPGFFKKPFPLVFWGFYWVLGFIRFWDFFYLNQQLGSLLVDLAHQLSFYLDSPVLKII